ncbi:hypothetical protein HDU83_003587 [Entophlyctis luteolus]|nr:hypothetical protein HDU83_003587 [Entophlyctis luteolus]
MPDEETPEEETTDIDDSSNRSEISSNSSRDDSGESSEGYETESESEGSEGQSSDADDPEGENMEETENNEEECGLEVVSDSASTASVQGSSGDQYSDEEAAAQERTLDPCSQVFSNENSSEVNIVIEDDVQPDELEENAVTAPISPEPVLARAASWLLGLGLFSQSSHQVAQPPSITLTVPDTETKKFENCSKEVDFVRCESTESFISADDSQSVLASSHLLIYYPCAGSVASAAEPVDSPAIGKGRFRSKSSHSRTRSQAYIDSLTQAATKLEQEYSGLSAKLISSEAECAKILAELEVNKEKIKVLTNENDELRSKNSNSNAKLESLEAQFKEVLADCSELKAKILSSEDSRKKLDTRITELEEALADHTAREVSLRTQLDKADGQLKKEQEIHQKMVEEQSQAHKEEATKANNEFEERIKSLCARHVLEMENLQKNFKSAQEKISTLESSLEAAESKSQKCNSMLLVAQKASEEQSSELQRLQLEKNDLQTQNLAACSQNLRNEKKIQSLETTISSLQQKCEDFRHDRDSKSENSKKATEKLRALNVDLEQKTKYVESLSEELQNANILLETSRQRIVEIESDLINKTNDLEEMRQHRDTLQSEICLHSAKLFQAEARSSEVDKEIAEQKAQFEAELANFRKAAENVAGASNEEIERLKAENSELKKTLSQAKIERRMRSTRISELWNELQSARNDFDSKKSENEKLRKEHQSVLEELQEIKSNSSNALAKEDELAQQKFEQLISELQTSLENEKSKLEEDRINFSKKLAELEAENSELQKSKQTAEEGLLLKDQEISVLKSQITDQKSHTTIKDNKTINSRGEAEESLMLEILGELATRGQAIREPHHIDAHSAENHAQEDVQDILKALDGTGEGTNSSDAKSTAIEKIMNMKRRMEDLEKLCRELEAFGHESLKAAEVLEGKYRAAQSATEQKEQVIRRLSTVLEDGASVIGRKRLQSVIAVARVAVSAPEPKTEEPPPAERADDPPRRDSVVSAARARLVAAVTAARMSVAVGRKPFAHE